MGTRGLIGLRFKNKDYLTYNHYDSYPEGIGVDILHELRKMDIEKVKKHIPSIILIDENHKPSKKHKIELKQYTNDKVGGPSTGTDFDKLDWYQVLRNAQGTLKPYIDGTLKYMIDSHEFINDSLFCEWGYIVNFDENCLEVWLGFQKKVDKSNRYGQTANDGGYYPCKLIKKYNLFKLPTQERFVKELTRIDEKKYDE